MSNKTHAQQKAEPGNYWVTRRDGWDGTITEHVVAKTSRDAEYITTNFGPNDLSVHDGQGNTWKPIKAPEQESSSGSDEGVMPKSELDLSCLAHVFTSLFWFFVAGIGGFGILYVIGMLFGK